MAEPKTDRMEVHPAIKALEAAGDPASEIIGYLGKAENGVVRLYADLSLSRCIEIPEESVVHIEPIAGETGKARAFVRADQKVREVVRRNLDAAASASVRAFPPDDRFPPPERGGLLGCYGRCESVFAGQAARILPLRSRALQKCNQVGFDDPVCQSLLREAAEAEAQAVGFLHDCLTACQAAERYRIAGFPLQPVSEIVAELSKKYLA